MRFEELKALYHDAVLTEEQLSDMESKASENWEINTEDYHSGIMCIGKELNGELFRFEATKYSCTNKDTGEKFYFYG